MKKIVLLFILVTSVCATNLNAQVYTTNVPFHMPFDSSYVVGQGMVDSFDIGSQQGYVSGQFVLCSNATFTFIGNQSSSGPSFYLYPGAKLILKDSYFYPTVYMMQGSELDAQGGSQNLSCYREMGVTLTDTANVLWLKDSIYTGMNFTFSSWPNASSPCSISPPQSVNNLTMAQVNVFVKNNSLNYAIKENGAAQLVLFSMHGRELLKTNVQYNGSLDLSHLPNGIYIVRIQQKDKMRIQKIILD